MALVWVANPRIVGSHLDWTQELRKGEGIEANAPWRYIKIQLWCFVTMLTRDKDPVYIERCRVYLGLRM